MEYQFLLNKNIDLEFKDFDFNDFDFNVNDFNDFNYQDYKSQIIMQKLSHKSGFEILYEILYRLLKSFFVLSVVIIGGSFISIVTVVFLSSYSHSSSSSNSSNSSSDSSDSSDSESDAEEYINKYMDKYEELEEKELDKENLLTFKTIFIKDKTPDGIIQMNYDTELEAFTYYINNKNIPYKYLETVGRLYIIENNCKTIYINYKDEIEKSKQEKIRFLEEKEKEKVKKEREDKEEGEKVKSVFANFKIYKSKSNDTKNNDQNQIINEEQLLPEKANKYIYKGKLLDYEELINKNILNEDFEHLDYSTFKKNL